MAGSRDVLIFLFHQMTGIANVGKVSEYQFHICNTANFFTSQKSKKGKFTHLGGSSVKYALLWLVLCSTQLRHRNKILSYTIMNLLNIKYS